MNIRVVPLGDVKNLGVFKDAFPGVGQAQHTLMRRIIYEGGLRVSELVNLRKGDMHTVWM